MRSSVFLLVLACLAGRADAAGFWSDKYGRILEMGSEGQRTLKLVAKDKTIDRAAEAFKKLCIDKGFEKTTVGAAAEAYGWDFAYQPDIIPFKDPADVGGWNSGDAVLTVANGIFFSKEPQCNLTVAFSTAPDKAEVISILSGLVGEPTNKGKAMKKDGTSDPRFQPEWRVSSTAGFERMVFVHVHGGLNAVQFAFVERKGAN